MSAFGIKAGVVPALKLTYFPIQGVAEKVRLALTLGNVPFEDVRVPFDATWTAMKPTTPYGQLPMLSIDGAEPMAQSDAMLRYAGALATQQGVPLYAPEDMLAIEEAMGLVGDFNRAYNPIIAVAMTPADFGHIHPSEWKGGEAHKAIIKECRETFVRDTLPKFMGFFAARFAHKAFLCGDSPTIADCFLVPILNRLTSGGIDFVPTTVLEAFPAVTAYVSRFMALPAVAAWYAPK